MKTKCFALLVLAVTFAAGRGQAFAVSGTAELKGTKVGSLLSGKAELTDTPDGLKISVTVDHVPPGKHGFHIHENGDCSDEGKAAGGHYNPEGAPHGLLSKDGFMHAHAGDFGNIEIDEQGSGTLDTVMPGLTLSGGKTNVAGRAFILHENADDFSQPTGNAGGRIGCGVIETAGA